MHWRLAETIEEILSNWRASVSTEESISKCVIRVRGQIDGLDFEFEEHHEALPGIADIRSMVEFYVSGIGMRPTVIPAAVSIPSAAGAPRAAAPQGGGDFTCPTHGDQNIKYDPRFNRFECKVRASRPEPWAGDKPWTDKDGNTWWFCRSRSS